MRNRESRAVAVVLLATDAALLLMATSIAFWLRFNVGSWPGAASGAYATLALLLLAAGAALAMLAADGLYRPMDLFAGHREYAGVVRACAYASFAILIVAFVMSAGLSRGALVLWWTCSCLSVGAGRFVFRRAVYRARRTGRFVRRALIVGCDAHAISIAARLSGPASGWQVLGFLDDYQPAGTEVAGGLQVLGDPSAAVQLAEAYGASDLILVPQAVSWEAQRDLLEQAATRDHPTLCLAPGFHHLLATGVRPVGASDVPLLTLERLRITGLDAVLKQAIDYAVSLAALPALAALWAALWAASRSTGGGPLFERRCAAGRWGRSFSLFAIAAPRPRSAANHSWAWTLRRAAAQSRLSKLPNVLNVLAGHMSLVGPRALPNASPLLDRPWTRTLQLVRPGLTGPLLPKGAWSPEEQAILDVAYVRGYSLWVDLRLLVASLRRALRRERSNPPSYQPAGEPALAEAPTF